MIAVPRSIRRPLTRVLLGMLLVIATGLALAAGVWWDNSANRGIPPGQVSIPRWADVPRGGVNTYLLHAEVVTPAQRASNDNKVARTFRMIRDAGFHWVRVQFPWEDIEVCGKGRFVDCRAASTGESTWTKYDYIVQQAQANDLELIVRLDRPPDWAREQVRRSPEVLAQLAAGVPVTGPPDRLEDYADYVRAVARRYRDQLRFYQLWNEPNLPGEWNYHRQDPAELVRLLRLGGAAIKAEDPDAVIVFPALSQTDGADGVAVNDLEYLQGVYDVGGHDVFDIMSAQLYGLGQPPDEHRYIKPGERLLRPIETRTDVSRIVLLREVMVRNGDVAKAVWISEIGWNSAPFPHPWGVSVSEQQKGEYLVGALRRAEAEWPWLGATCVWMFRWGGEPPHPEDPTPYFQLVDFDFNPLPAYETLARFLRDQPEIPLARRSLPAAAAPGLATVGLVLAVGSLWPPLAVVFAAVCRWAGERGGRGWRAARRVLSAPHLWQRLRSQDLLPGLILVIGLIIFYRASAQLPITLLGALIFVPVALLRPELALLAVPVTAPLYLAPKGVWDARFGLSRPEGYLVPLHEVVLLVALVGTLLRYRQAPIRALRSLSDLRRSWPIALFLLSGTLAVVIAEARGQALREWRWLIAEPLLFYGLVRLYGRDEIWLRRLIWTWVLAGVGIAMIGVLQLGGINVVPLISRQTCFSTSVTVAGGVRRASSVYCHPNNLGLALGRVWPVLAAITIVLMESRASRNNGRGISRSAASQRWLVALLCGIVLAGMGASFSKGAILAGVAAALVLGLASRQRVFVLGAMAVAALILIGGLLTRVERLNPLGGSSGARLELWTSAAAMLRDHPFFGVGLDQFYALRNAEGSPYLSAAAAATNERYASHPHNLVLDSLLRLGPLGTVAVAALVFGLLRRSWSLARRGKPCSATLAAGILASLVAALVHGLVDNFYFVPDLAFVFWLQLAVVDTLAEG